MTRILGIDTSCDDTSIAVVADGTTILSNVVASQVDVHHRYGGVVPELAAQPAEPILTLVRLGLAFDDLDDDVRVLLHLLPEP